MESVEFYIINGQTCIRRSDGAGKPLTPRDRDAVEFMLENMRKYFPQTVARLEEWASASQPNKQYYEYRMVDRFIRCNFGDADFLYSDIDEYGIFHLEEVRCPLRGICRDEGVVCKPKARMDLPEEEQKVVKLYARGFLPGEIAERLGKAESTCKQQIRNACRRLHLPHPRWLIRLFSIYPLWDT